MAKQTRISNFDILKAVFPDTPPTWDERINIDSKSNWDTSKTVIAGSEFEVLRNQIFEELVNRIAVVKFTNTTLNNPLSFFKSGSLPFGDTIQEIATDIVEAKEFNGKYSDQFEYNDSEVHSAYHRINRTQLYERTITDILVRRAFVDEYGLQSLLNGLVNSLYKSNTVDEFIYTKQLISGFIDNSAYPIKDTQKIQVPNILSNSASKDDLNSFIVDVKKVMRRGTFPSRNYNPSNLMNSFIPSDMVLILNSDVTSINEVNNLSSAFNPDYLDLNVPIISVDNLSTSNPKLIGCILDKNGVMIRNVLERVTTAYNAKSLYTNYFFHVHQIYAMSPFTNSIYIEME